MWVFGAGAAVLAAALALMGRLVVRRWRARRALERSFQREWFGLSRWAPLENESDHPDESAQPDESAPITGETWYFEGPSLTVHPEPEPLQAEPVRTMSEVAADALAGPVGGLAAIAGPTAEYAPAPAAGPPAEAIAGPDTPALDLDAPWPPSSHDEWVALLANNGGEPLFDEEDREPAPLVIAPEPEPAAESQPAPEPEPDRPAVGSPAYLASLAANLAPVPEYAPLAAELASLAAELASLGKDPGRPDAGEPSP